MIQKLRQQLSSIQDEHRNAQEIYEDKVKEVQRSVKQSQSEFDKEKALLDQKVEYLESVLKEKQDRERDSTSEMRNQKAELSQEIKQISARYDSEIKSLNKFLEDEKEKSADLEAKLQESLAKLEQSEKRQSETERTLQSQLAESQTALKELQQATSQLRQENDQQLSSKLKRSETELTGQKNLIEELERKVKESSEAYMQVSHDSKKTIAMRDQKIEFLTMQFKEAKDQLEESQRQHDSMVQALNKQNEASDDEGQSAARLEMLQKEFDAATETQLAQNKEIKAENDDLKQRLADVEH